MAHTKRRKKKLLDTEAVLRLFDQLTWLFDPLTWLVDLVTPSFADLSNEAISF